MLCSRRSFLVSQSSSKIRRVRCLYECVGHIELGLGRLHRGAVLKLKLLCRVLINFFVFECIEMSFCQYEPPPAVISEEVMGYLRQLFRYFDCLSSQPSLTMSINCAYIEEIFINLKNNATN